MALWWDSTELPTWRMESPSKSCDSVLSQTYTNIFINQELEKNRARRHKTYEIVASFKKIQSRLTVFSGGINRC